MSVKKSIYLDDFRTPIEHPEGKEWVIVRNYEQFVNSIEEIGLDNIDIISFDHDLDESAMVHYFEYVKKNYSIDYSQILEKTGMDAAKWIVEHSKQTGINLPECYVHSANPIGSGNIMGYINLYLKEKRLPESCIRTRWKYKK
jgi:hypothetical protein